LGGGGKDYKEKTMQKEGNAKKRCRFLLGFKRKDHLVLLSKSPWRKGPVETAAERKSLKRAKERGVGNRKENPPEAQKESRRDNLFMAGGQQQRKPAPSS